MASPLLHETPSHDPGMTHRFRARRRLVIFGTLVLLAVGGYWLLGRFGGSSLDAINGFESSVVRSALQAIPATSTLAKPFAAPPPLKAIAKPAAGSVSDLTGAGIIIRTNAERSAQGEHALTEDAALDAIALVRLDDMFAKQYFAHVAPDGGSVTTVAKTVNYEYLRIGENLALGDFAGDKGVVDAWMASPGHRANILDTHYTKIGVAARKGTYEGATTWIAVQVFSKPASDCPAPDANLKGTVDAAESQLSQMSSDLAQRKAAIDAMQPKAGSAYNQAVDAYNAEVAQYNALVGTTKQEVATYNDEVQAYNACIGG